MSEPSTVRRPRPPRAKNADRFKQIVRDVAEMAPAAEDLAESLGNVDLTDERETPDDVFIPLHIEFDFNLDVAASTVNAKTHRFCSRDGTYLGQRKISDADGLGASWHGRRVWCNPPFSDPRPWVEHAWAELAEVVVMLLPNNRAEQRFWQDLVEPFRDRPGSILTTRNLRKRRAFLTRDEAGALHVGKSPPFGLVVLIWDRRSPVPQWGTPGDESSE